MFNFRTLLVQLLLILFLLPQLGSAQNPSKKVLFSFNLKNSALTSAGVYKEDGTLLRTLWSGKNYKSGRHKEMWDGKDDQGNPVPETKVQVKVLSANVKYEWEGARIGNTSTALTGDTKHRLYEHITGMAIVGNTSYVACGYNEAFPSQYKFNTNDPQKKKWIGALNGTEAAIYFVDTDGTNVYWSGFDPLGAKRNNEWESFVFATKVKDDSQVSFGANGTMAPMEEGHTYSSVLSRITSYAATDNPNNSASPFYHVISGLAVMKKGNFLFVSRGGTDNVKVYNKSTGAFVRNISINDPGRLCTDGNDNLWMLHETTLEKYNVNKDGTITSTGLKKQDSNIQYFTVSPNSETLLVTDLGTQQVKAYSNTTGELLWSHGRPGGYLTDATAANDKFAFKDITNFAYSTYVTYQPDGSFWVGDAGNFRALHFDANRNFIEVIQFIQNAYSCSVDPNDPTRVFANYLEFKIDYSKPLDNGANGSWTFAKNWGAGFNSRQFDGEFDPTERLRKIITLSNGRTYGILRSSLGGTYPLMEFIKGGIVRNTGINMGPRGLIDVDGAYINCNGFALGQASAYTRRELIGFNALNNPKWSSAEVEIAHINSVSGKDPIPWENAKTNPVGDSVVVYFDYNRPDANFTRSDGYHLGAIKKGDNKWLWKTAQSTNLDYSGPFPKDGWFDIGNGTTYPGGTALMNGNNLFWNYKGEFYKQSQTNKWNHVDINTGLFIGQFGVVGAEIGKGEATAEMSGNVFTGGLAKVGDDIYIYHNDEGVHSALHRFKVTGLNTIEIKNADLLDAGEPDGAEGIDLLAGLPTKKNIALENNIAGWTRHAVSNQYTNGDNMFFVSLGTKTYDPFLPTDISVIYRKEYGEHDVTRTLGSNQQLNSWEVNGKISFDGGVPNGGNGGCFFEVLDDKDKIIARLFVTSAKPSGVDIRGNDQVIVHGADDEMKLVFSKIMPFSINATNGTITIAYGDFAPVSTAKKIDNGSNWQIPAKVRMYFYTNGQADNYYRMINISELRFLKNKATLTPPVNYFRSKKTGIWSDPLTWETSNDGEKWNDASMAPDTAANAIVIRKKHVVTINGIETVDQLTINKEGVLNVAPNGAIIVNDGEGDDIQIEKSGEMVIKSDATGTGRIGRSAGTIKGDVTVERYLPAKAYASYRMLAPSVNTSSTIRDNWQEGVNNLNVKDNIDLLPGYGTHITGSLPGINGFDASVTGKSSLFTFNQSTPGQGWAAINNTNVNTLNAKKGYLLFIRGNRSINLNDESKTGNTTLRATGSILSGTVTYEALESRGRNSVIANPYASPIDWVKLQAANSDQFENYYTLWDPNVGSKGGYVTVDATGTTSVRTSNATTEIQSGQAFIVKAKVDATSPTFKIDELHKSKTNNVNVFRATNEKVSKLYASLYYTDGNGKRSLGDGVLSRFDVDYASELDGDDAGDISNFDENIAFERNGKSLSIESRPFAIDSDTLFLNISNMKQQAYEWQFNASDFGSSTTTHAFLKDKYLGTEIPIELEGSTVIIFAITSDPASGDAKRFSIVFEKLKTLPVNMLSVKGYEFNNGVKVDWKTATEINMDKYEVERSIDGQVFTVAGALPAQGTSTSVNDYSLFDSKPAIGYNYYRIRSVSKDGSLQYSQVVRVLINKGTSGITIFPVPVKGSDFNVKLNNLQKGNYTLRLINVAGQTLVNHRVEHTGGTSIEKISSSNLKPGTYQLQVIGDNYMQTQQLIKL